ncbi:glycosyltransferase [Synechococcus sp. CS-1324]|uniref:glycosyltransferase family protein n=1 Tax=Synechococcus sp. CS-1324 TaxID=2847980 RepID=UPI00223AC2FD|nr:glycosyltransferase [Synechococcus sp. CS-1324]MCT0230727.1 glycosyltransferase [Synechococcus sp. CS-1324]
MEALRRLGNNVAIFNPRSLLRLSSSWRSAIGYLSGYCLLQSELIYVLQTNPMLNQARPDLVYVIGGELLGPQAVLWLKQRFSVPILLFNNDDPTGPRDWKRFISLRAALPFYDFCVCVREQNLLEWIAFGAQRVFRVLTSYDEVVHAPPKPVDDADTSESDSILFIGTLIPGEHRDTFLLKLKQSGLPIHLMGNRWQRSPHWSELRMCHMGNGILNTAYASALAKASICLGFLSHGNRDLLTRRSVEVPFAGSLLCAERTSEHQLLYEEGYEAIFWDTVEECGLLCCDLLTHPMKREVMRQAGSSRVRELGVGNEDISRSILNSI